MPRAEAAARIRIRNHEIGQVGKTVDRPDRGTPQNAALVEGSSAAADNLGACEWLRRAQQRVAAVGMFRLEGG